MSITGEKVTITKTANEIKLYIGPTGHGGKRGKVKGMSRGSSARLLSFVNSILFDRVDFITLTYRYNQTDEKAAYKDLRRLLKRVWYRTGGFCCVWKAERQKRGAMHYHLLAFDAPDSATKSVWVDEWMEVTGQTGDTAARKYGVRHDGFGRLGKDDFGVVVAYVGKYTSKTDGGAIETKNWGILGRRHAKEIKSVYDGRGADLANLAGELLRAGGKAYPVSGGGEVIRLYLGHIGRVGRESVRVSHAGSDQGETVTGYEQLALFDTL